MYLGVCEEENHILVFYTSQFVQLPQVLMKTVVIISPAQLNLQTSITAYMSCEPCKRLLSRASHSNQQGVASLLTNHASDPVGDKAEKVSLRGTNVASALRVHPRVEGQWLLESYSPAKGHRKEQGMSEVHGWEKSTGGFLIAISCPFPTRC